MTIVNSNIFRLNVIDPGATTVIGSLASSMSVGTWAKVVPDASNVPNSLFLGVGTGTGNVIPYATKMGYDPFLKKIQFCGHDHGDAPPFDIEYDEIAHAWINNGRLTSEHGRHAFDHNVVNPHTGDRYLRAYQQGSVQFRVSRKVSGGSTWPFLPTFSALTNVALGCSWWSGSLSGVGAQGALCIYECVLTGKIHIFDPLANAGAGGWSSVLNAKPSGWAMVDEYNAVAAYSAQHNCLVFGGGNPNSMKVARMNSDRSITALPDFEGLGPQRSNINVCPVSGDIILLRNMDATPSVNSLFSLNPTTGVYTQLTGSRQPPPNTTGNMPLMRGNPPSSSSTQGIVSSSIAEYGVILYLCIPNGSAWHSMWLYKHA